MSEPNVPSAWRRLHPTALIVEIVEWARTIVSALIALAAGIGMLLRNGAMAWIWAIAMLAAVALVAEPVATWLTTRYRLTDDGMELRTGLFNRKLRTVSYDRIHAVTVSQPIYMRPFDVIRLSVATGDSTEGSITLDAVPAALQGELERLRLAGVPLGNGSSAVEDNASPRLTNASSETAVSPQSSQHASQQVRNEPSAPFNTNMASNPTNRLVFRASTRDVLLFALTDLGFLAAALALWGIIQQTLDILPRRWARMATDSVTNMATRGALALAGLLGAVVAILLMLSVITSLLRFHGFEVWRVGNDITVTRGLITRRTMTMPISRIQTITIRQNVFRRIFGLCSVQLGLSASTSADQTGDAQAMEGTNVLPVIQRSQAYRTLGDMIPEWDLAEPTIRRTGRGLLRYYLALPLGLAVVAIAAAMASLPSSAFAFWAFLACAIVAMAWTVTRLIQWRSEGYEILPERSGAPHHRIVVAGGQFWSHVTVFTRRSRVQSATLTVPIWRERSGVMRLTMPLFVMNDVSWLRFTFIRRTDAAPLLDWFDA